MQCGSPPVLYKRQKACMTECNPSKMYWGGSFALSGGVQGCDAALGLGAFAVDLAMLDTLSYKGPHSVFISKVLDHILESSAVLK